MSNEKIKSILSQYDPICLHEMDDVKLMDRTDVKFVFPDCELSDILKDIQPFYRSLEVDGIRINNYETLYYDTENLELYTRHHCGKLNRYKIRSRKYVESDLHFFEVKYKNNRGRTIKKRVKTINIENGLNQNSIDLFKNIPSVDPKTLKATVWVNYSRITLVNRMTPERLTIDINLHFISDSTRIDMNNLVIAEVKQDKANHLSPIIKLFRQKRIHEGSISKYCLAVATMFDSVRKNNFKEKIRNINKLRHAA